MGSRIPVVIGAYLLSCVVLITLWAVKSGVIPPTARLPVAFGLGILVGAALIRYIRKYRRVTA